MNKNSPIGVFDSGVGGLTVVSELRKLMPGEDIIYFGDSSRCPYGSRPISQILEFSAQIVDFLLSQDVKAIVVACNTISMLLDRFHQNYDLPFVGIIMPACEFIAGLDIREIGIIATEATIQNGAYQSFITKLNPNMRVIGSGSPKLAYLIDCGEFNKSAIEAEIKEHIDYILEEGSDVRHIVLGCTHYSIIKKDFERLYPSIDFIDPARVQALAVKKKLQDNDGANPKIKGYFKINTSGSFDVYQNICYRLCCDKPEEMNIVANFATGFVRGI